MIELFVLLTTASCSGFAYRVQADDAQVGRLWLAVEAYNDLDRWKERGCDGTAILYRSEASFVECHNQDREKAEDPDGKVSSWAEFQDWISDDGDAYAAEADDLVTYLNSLSRQQENDFPKAA